MQFLEISIAGIMFVALTLYAVSGGADFGGGVWDLSALGERGKAQREIIAHALAPIWEANHVWLIVVIVVLFVGFPAAFATINIALHIPITLALLGIVMRGSAFAFRTYDVPAGRPRRRWSWTFSIASVVTPFMLGVVVGAITSGTIRRDPVTGVVDTDFISSWLAPYPFAVGFFSLSLFAYLAAVYLIMETPERRLQEDFRLRALWAAGAVAVMALVCLGLAEEGAPKIWFGLSWQWWSIPFHILTASVALGAFAALWTRRYALARILAIIQVVLVIWGWGLAQFPYIVIPTLTILNSAAPAPVLKMLQLVLVLGAVVLAPAIWYLYAIFKGRKAVGSR